MRSIRVLLTILAFLLSFAIVYSLRAGFDPSANVTQSPLSLIFSTDSNSIYTSPFSAVCFLLSIIVGCIRKSGGDCG